MRAVAGACAANHLAIAVPCHRVVRTDGTIGQYSLGGPANKRTILRSEGLDPDGLEDQARGGIRFVGSDTTHIVCLPTCHHAKRITPAHRVPFRSFGAALGSGYRACLACKPASGTSLAAA